MGLRRGQVRGVVAFIGEQDFYMRPGEEGTPDRAPGMTPTGWSRWAVGPPFCRLAVGAKKGWVAQANLLANTWQCQCSFILPCTRDFAHTKPTPLHVGLFPLIHHSFSNSLPH